LMASGGVLLLAPGLYLFLMLWARADPLQDWGRPATLPLLWNHASARFYHGHLHLPGGPYLSQSLRQTATLFTDNFPLVLGVLPFLGVWALWRRDRGAAAGLLLGALGVLIYDLCYRIDDIAPYYLTIWAIAATLIAVGLDFVYASIPSREGW